MSTAALLAEKLIKAKSVKAFKINADGSRGEELPVLEWNDCDLRDMDTSSLRLVYAEEFEIWYDECEEAEIDGESIKVNEVELVIS
jgi:hypothetical protein